MVNQYTGASSANEAGSVKNELEDDARRLKDTAMDQGQERAREEKERVAKSAKSASSAMDAAAEKLRADENAPAWMASAVSSAAQQVDDLAGRLQNKSPQDIARETSRFGRENPTAFLAASAAVGFAAARFFRAGADYSEDQGSGSSGQADGRGIPGKKPSEMGFQSTPPGSPWIETPSASPNTSFARRGEPQ